MPTLTFNATSNSGYWETNSTTYTTARAGGSPTNPDADNIIGQNKVVFSFFCYETFWEFDTSTIPAGAILDTATLKLFVSTDGSDTNFTIQARADDYGTSLTTGDFVPGNNLAALTLLATRSTSGLTASAYNSLTESGSALRNAINVTGKTRLILTSDRLQAATQPSGGEYIKVQDAGDANPPQLVITYHTTGSRTVTSTASVLATSSRTVSATAQVQTTEARTVSATASIVLTTDRTGQIAADSPLPALSLHLHTPMPDARPLAGLWFATSRTSLRIVTSADRGFESCQIGFPQRRDTGVVPAFLETAISEWSDMGHVLVGDGARPLFAGRLAAQPQFPRGELRAITAQGYWGMLNDGPYVSSDDTLTTSGAVILDMLGQRMPFVRIARWVDPGVSHAPSEYTNQPAGSSIDSLLKQGDGLGTPWVLQFWLGQDGAITAHLLPMLAPAVPDFECDWDDDVSLTYDPMAISSHIAVRYTPAGGSETLTEWQPLLSDGTFKRTHGYERQPILSGGQMSEAGAIAFRDTQQVLRSKRQWSGTITVRIGGSFAQAGSRVAVLPRDTLMGGWVRVRGHAETEGLLQIQKTDYDAGQEVAQLTVGQGLIARSLHERIIDTTQAVRSARNPISGAPAV